MKKSSPFLFLILIIQIELCSQPEFVNYINKNTVCGIAIHSDTLWLATNGGVLKYDINGNLLGYYSAKDGIYSRAGNIIIEIAIDSSGNKWFGYAGGASIFDGNNWTTYTESKGVNAIVIDRKGNKWFGTTSGVSMLVDSSTGIKDGKDISNYFNTGFSIYPSGRNLFINYNHKAYGKVDIFLYNLHGKCIHRISEYKTAGKHSIKLNTTNISCGSYICRIKTADGIGACKKIVIMR